MQKVSKNKIVDSYAKAWLDASFCSQKQEDVYKEVLVLSDSVEKNADLWQKIMMPLDDDKVEVVKAISQKIKLTNITSNTLILMAENQRLEYLPLVLKSWQKQYYEKQSIVEVDVETVVPLTATQNKKLIKVLEGKLNQQVKVNYIINKDILGGLKVSYKSFIIDDTIRNKLDTIKKQMLKG